MKEQFQRTEMLLGTEAMNKLAASRVAVFGLGGVGGHAMEALVRTGIGAIDLIDFDTVDITNLNRQIIATVDTIGQDKTEAAARRAAAINPDCKITVHKVFYLPAAGGEAEMERAGGTEVLERAGGTEVMERAGGGEPAIDFSDFDYVVDAIDTVAGKMALVEDARRASVPIICSMGAGNKLDASAFKVADIYDTSVCPLAKVIRRECRKRGIESLKVVYSEEEPVSPRIDGEAVGRKRPPGSVAFAPAVAGLIMAGEVVRDICGITR